MTQELVFLKSLGHSGLLVVFNDNQSSRVKSFQNGLYSKKFMVYRYKLKKKTIFRLLLRVIIFFYKNNHNKSYQLFNLNRTDVNDEDKGKNGNDGDDGL